VLFQHVFNDGISQRVEHPVTGAGAEDEVICKGNDFFEIDQDDIFTLFIFKGIYNFSSKI
jgi:hypothetical protein